MGSRPVPIEGIFMAMFVGLAMQVIELKKQLQDKDEASTDRGMDI